MGHPPRIYEPGVSMHVIRRGNNRGAIVRDDADRRYWVAMIRDAASACQVDVHGYTLMTTHYHFIATPRAAAALRQMMKALGEDYVRYYNDRHDRIGTLWAGRYRALPIRDEVYWLTCLRYVEQNPWRAKMVGTPEAYRWSSCRFHMLGEPSDWLVPHPVYLALGAMPDARRAAYRAICLEPLSDQQLDRQRKPSERRDARHQVSDTGQRSGEAEDKA